jgi:hypothetical protein
MTTCSLDHLVVTTPKLHSGVEFIEDLLHVKMHPGGEHPRMGTHNCVLRIGQQIYLEVIAINPNAPPVYRPRWFELDEMLPDAKPRLATWMIRSANLADSVKKCAVFGPIEQMSRNQMVWKITIPADGSLPYGGVCPGILQWEKGGHPTDNMPDSEVSLRQLSIVHPEAATINQLLSETGFVPDDQTPPVSVNSSTGLMATLQTPRGIVVLK